MASYTAHKRKESSDRDDTRPLTNMDTTNPLVLDPWDAQFPFDEPPAKRSKTSHPYSVVCCDQPCPEDTLCWEDFCHDLCTDLRKQSCEKCPEPVHDGAECDDPHCTEPVCTDICSVACTDAHCGMSCPDNFCHADSIDACADPATACFDDCSNWCHYHGLDNCLDCLSSPATTDTRTPQIPPTTAWDSFVMDSLHNTLNPAFMGRQYTPFYAQTPQTATTADASFPCTSYPTPQYIPASQNAQSNSDFNSQHICQVIGCLAGSFNDEDALQDHIEKSHLVKLNNKYICQWHGCVKKVTKKSNEHIQKEKEARAMGFTYVPPPEPFSDDHLHKLKRHYYVHSGKKAFECDYPGCGSVHATKAQLKVHKARHNPKEFTCEDCDKVFTTQSQLKTHVNAVHKKQKHFKCPDCDYACDDSSNMSSHKRKQHQLGVLCPCHLEYGCLYRDGRQSEMEKHMRACNHSTWMLDDKDSFDAHWKLQKKVSS